MCFLKYYFLITKVFLKNHFSTFTQRKKNPLQNTTDCFFINVFLNKFVKLLSL